MFQRWKNSFNKRFNKNSFINRLSRKENSIKQILVPLPIKDEEVKYWRDSYLDYFTKEVAFYKNLIFMPKSLAKKLYKRTRWHEYVKNSPGYNDSEILNLHGIKLPKPEIEQNEKLFGEVILDVLLQYLLAFDEDMIKNVDYDFYRIFPEGPYEFGNVYLSEGDIVIDAGACMGEFSALAVAKGCEAHAFEPSKFAIERYL